MDKRDMLLTVVAITVQNTEALSDGWPRQKELLELLTPKRQYMVNSFYANGYFVPRGEVWEQYVEDLRAEFGIDFSGDMVEIYDPILRVKFFDELKSADAPMEIVNDAFKFVDAFEG